MITKIYQYMWAGFLSSCFAAALTACSSNDDLTVVPPAEIPTAVSFSLPENLQQLIYVDEAGSQTLPLLKGETVKLSYSMTPDNTTFKDVEWSSSNEEVATVSPDGTVTALSGNGLGYSMIQVKPVAVYSGSGINAVLKITVSNEVVPATGITVASSADDVYEGDQITLSSTVTPANATYRTVSWSVSDANIASIDVKGVLTAKTINGNSATVTVTAKALDGSGVTATRVITIHKIVQPQSVTIDPSYSVEKNYFCAINEKTLKLTFTTVPAESTHSLLKWTSDNPEIATVENGVVKFNQEGKFGQFTITATCPETDQSSSITMNLAAGLVRETFHNKDSYSWYNAKQSGNGTETSHVWHDGYITITTYTQNATNQRADIKCWDKTTWLHAGNYPIFAFRMDDVTDMGLGITSRNINIDAVGATADGTQYKAIANGNNKWLHDYKCSDGSHIFIYDLSQQACGTGGIMPTNETVAFSILQIKHADMKTITHQFDYNLYWVQTFKTIDDLEDYVKNTEGLTWDVIK
jgi:uncharacterized protein YjdB